MYTVVWQHKGQSPAGVVEEHGDHFSNEGMLKLGLERWTGSRCPGSRAGRGEKGICRIQNRCDSAGAFENRAPLGTFRLVQCGLM